MRWPVMRAICRREMHAYFDTPAAYIIIIVFLLIAGYMFGTTVFLWKEASAAAFVENAPLLLTFLIPAVTMRLFSEEFRSGSFEFTATLPISDEEIVAAKYLSTIAMSGICLACGLIFPLLISGMGSVDWGQVACSYIGLFLICMAYCAIGIWASSMSRNQVVAFILGFAICFFLFMVGKTSGFLPGFLSFITEQVGLDAHMASMYKGVLELRDVVYFLSIAVFFLWSCWASVSSRRWR